MQYYENEDIKNSRLYTDEEGFFVVDKNFPIGLKGLEELRVRFDALSKYIDIVAENLSESTISIEFDIERIQEMIKSYKETQEAVHKLFLR